jgi:hypothetical protein
MSEVIKVKWACPKCGADANGHGRGGYEKCLEHRGFRRGEDTDSCNGFLCECDGDTGEHHGESFDDPCYEARCHHCGFIGTFPVKPKGLLPWEKKALEAGWGMPTARKKELKL